MKVKHLLFSMIAAAFLSSAISTDKSLTIGKDAPEIETINGSNVGNDANNREKTRLISFWSPKKPMSRIINRELSRQYGENREENIEFISICIDSDESLMNEVMKIDGINAEANYSYSQISPRVFKDYDVIDNPKAFKISPEGKISEII